MANASSTSLGLDLGDQEIDSDAAGELHVPMFSDYKSVATEYLKLASQAPLPLPAHGNIAGGRATGVVVQRFRYSNGRPDSGLEGHEVVYEEKAPKYMYRCFLDSLRTSGVPTVVNPGAFSDELKDSCPTGASASVSP
jgi:hypothetical protein